MRAWRCRGWDWGPLCRFWPLLCRRETPRPIWGGSRRPCRPDGQSAVSARWTWDRADPGRSGAQSRDCSVAIALLDCSPRIWSFLLVARLPASRGEVRSRGPCLCLQGHVTHSASALGIAAAHFLPPFCRKKIKVEATTLNRERRKNEF